MPVIECVPNVSEGRDSNRIAAMADAVSATPGVRLLDRSFDEAHNRAVLTFAGDQAGLLAAVTSLFEAAVASIDLRTHQGVHPRIGAVDVVPFVPVHDATMAECVALARTAGAEIARRFAVPVFLYEEAASHPARRRLSDIRRGGAEGLGARMAEPGWAPDFGPATPHPSAGATAIGARRFLIAFNVNLATDRVEAARNIARRVRESSGGLPHVRALGLSLEPRGITQVSMNLTNFEATPIERAFDAVAALAAELDVEILESELVGLIPRAALAGTTPKHLRLKAFTEDRILENRLRAAGLLPPNFDSSL
jgi:glutamate formiminotransferase / 5-formyltetrahydrofolate cyclo-ligase